MTRYVDSLVVMLAPACVPRISSVAGPGFNPSMTRMFATSHWAWSKKKVVVSPRLVTTTSLYNADE